MTRAIVLLIFPLAAGMAACASREERKPEPASPRDQFAFGLQHAEPSRQPSLVQAQLAGNQLLGLFSVESLYEARQADRRQDSAGLGGHALSQGLQTSLPLPLGSPLQIDFNGRVEQRWTETGLLTAQQRAATARWSDGGVQLAVDARRSSENSAYGCGIDASLRAAVPELLRGMSANAEALQLGGQLCERTLPGALPQQARILSAQTGWKDSFGSRQLRVSHAAVREHNVLTQRPDANAGGGVELSAIQAMQLGGWSLSQEVAVGAADQTTSETAAWAARSQLSRKVLSVPVTASWQRSEATLWSLGGAPQPGRETSLGVDLSRPLQQWLSPSSGASLSYHRVDPAAKNAASDDQIRLGMSLGW